MTLRFGWPLAGVLLTACSAKFIGPRTDDAGSVPTTTTVGGTSELDAAVRGDAGSPPGHDLLCDAFCARVVATCVTPYNDSATCNAVCKLLPEGAPGERSTNSIHCRSDPLAPDAGTVSITHACWGAAPTGGGYCGDRCESFCALAMNRCHAPFPEPFSSDEDCLTTCRRFEVDPSWDEYSDYPATEMNCRQFHLLEAFRPGADVALHCKALAQQGSPCN